MTKKRAKSSLSIPKTSKKVNEIEERLSLVIDCNVKRLTVKESLNYLKRLGHPIGATQLYKDKVAIQEKKSHEINHIAKENGFADSHMDIIYKLRVIEKEYWINYTKEEEPSKKASILRGITELQVYISSAYDSTKAVIREQAELKQQFEEPLSHEA